MTVCSKYEPEELIPIVSELAQKYTSKESSSVTYEVARQLMEAVEYCINENEYVDWNQKRSGQQKKEETLLELDSSQLSAKEAYKRGYQIVLEKAKEVKEVFNQMVPHFESYGNENLKDTVIEGIPGFITHYNAKFNPQDQILTMDYPILSQKTLENQCGVDVILVYLQEIALEQRFLQTLPRETVKEILSHYHSQYEQQYFNLCSPVLIHLLGCLIAKKNVTSISWSEAEYDRIIDYVLSRKKETIKVELEQVLQHWVDTYITDGKKVYEYLCNGIDEIVVQLFQVVKNDCIEKLFSQE